MPMYTPGAPKTFLPDEVGPLIATPVTRASVAMQVATVVPMADRSHDYRVPIVTSDPAAAWTAEGAEITPDDAGLDEIVVATKKLAALTVVSREMAQDSDPAATELIGAGIARDLARRVDLAFFGTNVTEAGPPEERDENCPRGLLDVAGYQEVDTGGTITNTDPFAEALSKAETVGAATNYFVAHPATVLALAKVKKATGSNEPLLGADAASPSKRSVLGVPVISSPAVAEGDVWAIPTDRVHIALRDDVDLQVDGSAFFTTDRIAIRATMRLAFAFPHPQAIVRLYDVD